MNIWHSIFLFFIIIQTAVAQQIICSAKDKELFTIKMAELKNAYATKVDFGETIVSVGKTFLGTPYVAKTLEVGEKESLVVNLRGLDCTTFVENVLVFSLLLKNGKDDFDSYAQFLEKVRYRDGKLDGYPSRLHYFSEWISDNEQKGLIVNITGDIGGKEIVKNVNFMSTHRELYPFLKSDANFEEIKASEIIINKEPMCVLAQDQIAENEHLIQSGDIIALATSIKGLDITHTGIATRESDGRIHLLHASTSGQVVVSKLPLADYLKKIKNNTGIVVNRVQ